MKRGSVRVREKEVKILNNYFAKSPIANIIHNMYQNMLIDLDKKGYARTTISGANTCANMVCKYAKRSKLIKENPREDAVVPKKSITVEELENDTIEETYFESHELDKFLDAMMSIGLHLERERFYTLAFSGLRSGKLVALKKEGLNFEENKRRISTTLYNENNNMKEYQIDTTKTNKVYTHVTEKMKIKSVDN